MISSNYEVRAYSWSKKSDFRLPAWKRSSDWLDGFQELWSPGTEISEISDWPDFLREVNTESENQLSRKLYFIKFSETFEGKLVWRLFCDYFELEYPTISLNDAPVSASVDHDYPGVAFVLDPISRKADLSNLTIMIPHWESFGFLRLCLWSIEKYYSETGLQVLVLDDFSSDETYKKIQTLCSTYNASLIRIERVNRKKVADVGMLLDIGLTHISTKYVCMLDADTIHTSSNTYEIPLELLRKKSVVSVGLDTGLGASYHTKGIWKELNLYPYDVSYPQSQTVTNNLFRIMRTSDALAVAQTAKFSRQVESRKLRDQAGRIVRKLMSKTGNQSLIDFSRRVIQLPIFNSSHPNMPPTGDNGVSANYWMTKNEMGLKVNIPIQSYGLMTPTDGICFQNIGNSLIHIALSTRALSSTRREVNNAGSEFYDAVSEIVMGEKSETELTQNIATLAHKIKIDLE